MRPDAHSDRAEWIRSALTEYEGPLLRYALRLTGDLESARDVVQDTFLRLCRENPAERNSHLAQWLFTVCRNRALDVCRKDSRSRALSDTELNTRPSDDPTPADTAALHEATSHVLGFIASLPVNQQEVVRLKFQNGFSYQQISAVTKLSVTNVGFLLHTALKTLRRQMQSMEGASHEV